MDMQLVHPAERETYAWKIDDGCVVVSSGDSADAPKVWLSKAMIQWLATEGIIGLELQT